MLLICLLCFIGIDFFFYLPLWWGCCYHLIFFSSCQNVNFNEKFLQTGLPLSGMSLQAKLGLVESEMLIGLFSHAYRSLGHTDTYTLPSVPTGLYALQHIHTQLSYKGAHISSIPYTPILISLTPYTHTFILLYPCPTVFYLDTQNCVCHESICKPVLQTPHCPLPYVSTQVLPYIQTHLPMPQSHTLNTTPSPTIP